MKEEQPIRELVAGALENIRDRLKLKEQRDWIDEIIESVRANNKPSIQTGLFSEPPVPRAADIENQEAKSVFAGLCIVGNSAFLRHADGPDGICKRCGAKSEILRNMSTFNATKQKHDPD